MATQRRTVAWVDAAGHTTATLLTTVSGAAALQAALAAKSNAVPLASWEGDLVNTSAPVATNATYASTADSAVLLFQTAAGTAVKLRIPAPLSSIFHADGETVDDAQIADIIAQTISDAVTQDGSAVVSFVAGYRSRA